MSGHSDLVCGACIGETSLIKVIRSWRNKLGNTASPFTSWLLSRSLETVTLRMQASQQNAQILAPLLARHPAVERLVYPGAGSMLSLWLQGPDNPKKAWAFLNQLKIIQLAVSLGSNESLACHPASTTHSGVDPKERHQHGIDERLIRLSIGIEDPEDLWEDLEAALEASMNV
jgi:methionine-gamma-lyase